MLLKGLKPLNLEPIRNIMKKQTAVEWLQDIASRRELDVFDFELAKTIEQRQMKNQTAVEYLIQEIKNDAFVQSKTISEWLEVFDKAKAMEREQMEEAVSNGISKADMVDNRGYFNFDKWYNETYGGKQ